MHCLEETAILTCAEFGIQAHTTEHTGVWVEGCKICAIGQSFLGAGSQCIAGSFLQVFIQGQERVHPKERLTLIKAQLWSEPKHEFPELYILT